MAIFAIIVDGIVSNIIVAASVEVTQQTLPEKTIIQVNDMSKTSIGDFYNAEDGKYYIDKELTKEHGYIALKTNSELYSEALDALSSQYREDISILASAYNLAALTDGVAQASKQVALQSQFATLKLQFVINLAIIKTQYGV